MLRGLLKLVRDLYDSVVIVASPNEKNASPTISVNLYVVNVN